MEARNGLYLVPGTVVACRNCGERQAAVQTSHLLDVQLPTFPRSVALAESQACVLRLVWPRSVTEELFLLGASLVGERPGGLWS